MTTRKAATKMAQSNQPTKGMDQLDEMSVGQLQAKFAEVVGEKTRSPNKVYLLRRIREAFAADAPAADAGSWAGDSGVEPAPDNPAVAGPSGAMEQAPIAEPDAGAEPVGEDTLVTGAAPATSPKLTDLDVPALKELYREIIGRDTASDSRNYLVWKLREARKGRIPLGPRASRRQAGGKVLVLPVRIESHLVERLDEAWPRLGLRSRTDLFRVALRTYFAGVGEEDLADRLRTDA